MDHLLSVSIIRIQDQTQAGLTRQDIASNAMTCIQTISNFFVSGKLALLFLRLQYILNVFKFWSFVKSLSMPIESLLTTIFFLILYIFSWDQKLTSNTNKTLRKWAKSSEAETASSKRRPVQPPLPFYRKDALPAKKWQVNNVLPPRRLIAPSLLTTGILAWSKHSSSKKLLLHENLPKPPKGASKLTSFRAILAVCMHAAVRAEGLLAPSSARFSVDTRCRLCKGLGSLLSYPLLVATLCFNPAEGPQTASRSAECRVAELYHVHWHCIYAYHMSRVGFYGEDQSEALKRHVVLSHTTCRSITRVWLTSDLPVPSAPEIFQSAMWYGIIPAWVVLCHTTWLENSKRERSMKGSFPPVVFRNPFEWRWA